LVVLVVVGVMDVEVGVSDKRILVVHPSGEKNKNTTTRILGGVVSSGD
jgi:hypothetical protein